MKNTEQYNLNQWEASDRIRMEDFNADNRKLEAALLEKTGRMEYIRTVASQGGWYTWSPAFYPIKFDEWDAVFCWHDLRETAFLDDDVLEITLVLENTLVEKVVRVKPGDFLFALFPRHDLDSPAMGYVLGSGSGVLITDVPFSQVKGIAIMIRGNGGASLVSDSKFLNPKSYLYGIR